MIFEQLDYFFFLILAQQTVVDENAAQLVANSFVHYSCTCVWVNASTYGSKHILLTHLLANVINRRLDKALNVPVRLRTAYCLCKVLQDLGALFSVDYLWMELNPIQFFLRVANSC